MRRAAKALVKCGAVCATLFGLALPAAVDAEPPQGPVAQDEKDRSRRNNRWIPSLAFVGGAAIQKQQASQESLCFLGGPADEDLGFASCNFNVGSGIAPLRPPADGSDIVTTPFVGANLQLMSPTFERIPGRPRLFAHGELSLNFGSKRSIAIEGDPTGVRLPDTVSSPTETATLLLNGVGSRTSSEYELLSYGAGIGVAFPFEFWGRKLWLKPSVAWTRFEIAVDGLVVAGLKDDPATQTILRGEQIREITLTGSETQEFDGIGPGVELELEAGEFGPLGATVFMNFNAYKVLGNTDYEIGDAEFNGSCTTAAGVFKSVCTPISPPGNPNGLPTDLYGANWNFSTKPWIFRTAVGMRIEWLGY